MYVFFLLSSSFHSTLARSNVVQFDRHLSTIQICLLFIFVYFLFWSISNSLNFVVSRIAVSEERRNRKRERGEGEGERERRVFLWFPWDIFHSPKFSSSSSLRFSIRVRIIHNQLGIINIIIFFLIFEYERRKKKYFYLPDGNLPRWYKCVNYFLCCCSVYFRWKIEIFHYV